MSAIRWSKELLAEVRNEKGVVFVMMSEAAQTAIQYERQFSHLDIMDDLSGIWTALTRHPDIEPSAKCFKGRAYRLSPSYTPPELEEKPWVDVPVKTDHEGVLVYKSQVRRWEQAITIAGYDPDFMCFVYADGGISMSPRNFHDNIAKAMTGPAEAPVAVRFWKGGAK